MSNRLYTTIPAPKVPRNVFDRSRPNSLTMPFQKVVPTMLEEIVPGDRFRIGQETFARLQPMIAPVMNNMKISNHAFFVPLRTINKHFAEFMFNNKNGDYSEVLPYVYTDTIMGVVEGLMAEQNPDWPAIANIIRLLDFIGLPFRTRSLTGTAQQFVQAWDLDSWNQSVSSAHKRVNLLPFVAYTKIWNEYFRDENLVVDPFEWYESQNGDPVETLMGDCAANSAFDEFFALAFMQLRPRAWAHDRFTSSLPFAQRGPDVLLPIAGTADVSYKEGWTKAFVEDPSTAPQAQIVKSYASGAQIVEYSQNFGGISGTSSGNNGRAVGALQGSGAQMATGGGLAYDPNGSLQVDFADAALTTTINTFRRAERLQRWYENSARGGVRPNEATLAHFGVRTADATLQRAEFLGGHKQPIVVSEVAQTSETTQSSPQGTLAGKGTSYKGGLLCNHFFTEHGFLFVFTSALCRANYWQGIPKVFSRMQRDEYYWPEFANLGEEPVFTKELYAPTSNEDDVFGYVPRFSDYKSAVGEVHGDMRSSLDFWTQNREFSNTPALNEEFIYGNPNLSPFAVQGQYSDPIVCTIQFAVKASRLMPFYGVPTI